MNKKEIKEFVKANKWFTYEQAENELRKHWNSDCDKDGDYLKIKRRQIQKILRSDIIGTYLEMDKRDVGITEEEIFMKKLYGWTAEETFYLEYYDSERDDIIEEEYTEKLHVFPKYDRLFPNNESSMILSTWDEQLGEDEYTAMKVFMREVYEKVFQLDTRGNTAYIMNESYLFALKHELERREYPTKIVYLKPHSPKEITKNLSNTKHDYDILQNSDILLKDFNEQIENLVITHNKAKDVEIERYFNIDNFFIKWQNTYPEAINRIISSLKEKELFEKFFKIKSELSNSFIFDLDIKKEKEKLSDKYKDFTFTEDKIKSISSSIYSYEKYQLEKLEIEISKDNSIISESAQFRYIFGITLREQVEKLHYDNELLLRSLDNIGIR